MEAVQLRYSNEQPVIDYTLSIDIKDLSFINMEMRIRNIPDTFRVAMVAHPEYDDRYWRYVEDLIAEGKKGKGNIFREDSSKWRIVCPGGEVTLHYNIHLPAVPEGLRAAWKPFLTATGGLVGGPHCFMYILDKTLSPAFIQLKLPEGWQAATGLSSTFDPKTFFAPSTFILTNCPILIGQFKDWSFIVDGIPHRVEYWALPDSKSFDSIKLVSNIQRIVNQARMLFGRLPYKEYSFLLQDNAYGSLEHTNSVTLGAPSSQLAEDQRICLSEIAHEYFHTWNLVRIHPVEYGDVNYKKPPLSRGLWWSEGLTMYYANLLMRRAGIQTFDSTRIKHLENLIQRYLGNPGNNSISAEKVSLAEYASPGMLGDYMASSHLQGELIGTMLDLFIRNATNEKKNMDDVMRKMMERFSGEKGFTGEDIERVIKDVCGHDVRSFFDDHIRGNKIIDLKKFLSLAGLQLNVLWQDAKGEDEKKSADLRVYAWQKQNETSIRIGITNPSGCWAIAGLHTGNIIISINDLPIKTTRDFWQAIHKINIGDSAMMAVQLPDKIKKITVMVTGYQQPIVHIEQMPSASLKQKQLFADWVNGK